MEKILNYYYDELCKKVKVNVPKEEFNKSIPIIEEYIAEYHFYLKKALWHTKEKSYIIPLVLNDSCNGIIKLSANNVTIGINKEVKELNIKMTECIKIVGEAFTGNLVDFVPNFSETEIIVEDKPVNKAGAIIATKFNDKGIINSNNGKIYEYDVNTAQEKISTACRLHALALEEQYSRFMFFDNLNIKTVNIHKQQEEDDKTL